jgi:hypothetical protein
MVQSPLPLVNSLVTGSVSLATNSVATSARMAMKSEELLEEVILTMRAARPVIEALGEAIEAGLLDDVNELLSTVSETQDDVRAARDAVERLVGLINTTLDGVGGVPGAQLILKGVARVAGGTKTAIPVVLADPEDKAKPSQPAKVKMPNPVAAVPAAAKAAAKVAGAAAPKSKPAPATKKSAPAKKAAK